MEEEKAAAYYDELSHKGSGAARFKQGLGFSSVPSKASALPSSSSFLSTFVKASSPSNSLNPDQQSQTQPIQTKLNSQPSHKQTQLHSIQNKLKSKSSNHSKSSPSPSPSPSPSCDREGRRNSKRGSRSRDEYSRRKSRSRERNSRHRSPSGSGDRYLRRRSRSRERVSRRKSPSGSGDRHSRRSRSRERDSRRRSRSRERSLRRRSRSRERDSRPRRGEKSVKNERNGRVDYGKLIQGYDKMAPAERVKAKMKLQLTETAKNDPTRGTGSGWERFDFDKDAALDDEEIEAAEDDSSLVKHIGQSFRFSAVEAMKEDQIKAAHDEAMFGAPSLQLTSDVDEEKEDSPKCPNESAPDTSLISNQVISMQQVSWRDRVKKM